MAQVPFRGNTQGMTFPLLSTKVGMTVINPGPDQTYAPQVSTDGAIPIDRGVASAVYAHNVMPSINGWRSVGYQNFLVPPDAAATDPTINFDRCFYVQGAKLGDPPEDENGDDEEDKRRPEAIDARVYIALGRDGGSNAIFRTNDLNKWYPIANGQPAIPDNCEMTTAEVNGVTYIYFSYVGCYIYDPDSDTLIERELKGLDKESILGIVSSAGYLMAYTSTAYSWSSAVDVEDFDPEGGDISGAGGGQVQEAKGPIVCARPTFLGVLLFTTANAISVTFSGNENFPWNFKAIPSAGGISNTDMVGKSELGTFYYAFTTAGMQQITHSRATTVLATVTDFFGEQVFEDFDSETNTFTRLPVTWPMRKKVATVADRYLIISYGYSPNEEMTHAVIMDMSQNRMGKLKCPHNYVFERVPTNNEQAEIPKESIVLLSKNGSAKVVDFSEAANVTDAVLFLGRFQLVRQRFVQLQEIFCTSMAPGDASQLVAIPTLDGFTEEDPQYGYVGTDAGNGLKRYLFPALVGKNFSLILKGKFDLFSYEMWLTPHGRF